MIYLNLSRGSDKSGLIQRFFWHTKSWLRLLLQRGRMTQKSGWVNGSTGNSNYASVSATDFLDGHYMPAHLSLPEDPICKGTVKLFLLFSACSWTKIKDFLRQRLLPATRYVQHPALQRCDLIHAAIRKLIKNHLAIQQQKFILHRLHKELLEGSVQEDKSSKPRFCVS